MSVEFAMFFHISHMGWSQEAFLIDIKPPTCELTVILLVTDNAAEVNPCLV